MSALWRKKLGLLDFPLTMGIYNDLPFRAQALQLTATPVRGRVVFARNDQWPDSDIRSRFVGVNVTFAEYTRPGDPASLDTEIVLYPLDEDEVTRSAVARIRSAARRGGVGAFYLTVRVDEALQRQRRRNDRFALLSTSAPWLLGASYDGDYEQALWALDEETGELFPIALHDSSTSEVSPIAATLRDGVLMLTDPLPSALAGSGEIPVLPDSPVRLRTYAIGQGEDEREVSAQIRAGVRMPSRILEVGAHADIVPGAGPARRADTIGAATDDEGPL